MAAKDALENYPPPAPSSSDEEANDRSASDQPPQAHTLKRSATQPPSESQPSKKLDTSAHPKTAFETELDSDSDSDADSDPAAPEIAAHALDGVERDLVKKLREMAEGSKRVELKKKLNKLDVKYLEFLVMRNEGVNEFRRVMLNS